MSMLDGGQTTVPLRAIRLGDTALCAIPFETFVEIGLELKERGPYKLGDHETWLGACRVQEDASVLIIDRLLQMLAELKKETAP